MVLTGFQWQPSLGPRIRDHPAGVGYRNYFPVDTRDHSASSPSMVERVIKATSVEFSYRIQKSVMASCAPASDLWPEQLQAHISGKRQH
jgi:hypothetical protein